MSTGGGLDRPDVSPCSGRRKMGVNLRSRDPNVISPHCPRILLSCCRARNSGPEITSPTLELRIHFNHICHNIPRGEMLTGDASGQHERNSSKVRSEMRPPWATGQRSIARSPIARIILTVRNPANFHDLHAKYFTEFDILWTISLLLQLTARKSEKWTADAL